MSSNNYVRNDTKLKTNIFRKFQIIMFVLILTISNSVNTSFIAYAMDSETQGLTTEAGSSSDTPDSSNTSEVQTSTDALSYFSATDFPAPPEIVSQSAIVMDAKTGQILYEKNAYDTQYPASTTKILTALLALENGNLDDTVTMSYDAINGIEPDSNNISCQVGEVFSLRDALYAVLLFSANEVSSGVAEYVAGDVDSFCNMMNEKASSLGCVNSHFANANGLTLENHYSCAYDLALIAKEAIKNSTFFDITSTVSYQIPATNLTDTPRDLFQSNRLIRDDTEYYYPYCQGGKTGYTLASGGNLVSWAEKDDIQLICVVLSAPGNPDNYYDSAALYKYFFNNYHRISPMENYDFSPTTKTSAVDYLNDYYGGKNLGGMTLTTDLSVSIICPNTITNDNIEFPINFTSDRLSEGIIGDISVVGQGQTLTTLPIYYADYISSTDKAAIEEAYANGTLKREKKKAPVGLILFFIVVIAIIVFVYIRRQQIKHILAERKRKSLSKYYDDDDEDMFEDDEDEPKLRVVVNNDRTTNGAKKKVSHSASKPTSSRNTTPPTTSRKTKNPTASRNYVGRVKPTDYKNMKTDTINNSSLYNDILKEKLQTRNSIYDKIMNEKAQNLIQNKNNFDE